MTALVLAICWLAGAAAEGPSAPLKEQRANGEHWTISTAKGQVHLWRPEHYQQKSAGVVIYLHGYFIDVDGACREHWLPEQFAASLQNALFISAESPKGDEEGVSWDNLEELLNTVFKRVKLRRPPGPLVAVGHSGAFRTIVSWLSHPDLSTIILLDGLYTLGLEPCLEWIKSNPRHRLILVGYDTHPKAIELATRFPVAVIREGIPEKFSQFTQAEFQEQLVIIHSQYGHMEMITQGQVIPMVLRLSPLKALPAPLSDPRSGLRNLLEPPPVLTNPPPSSPSP